MQHSRGSKSTSSEGRPPSFVHIGGMRCGTTWMYLCLAEHPEVFTVEERELHYFDGNYDKGKRWYASHFTPAEHYRAWGEKTPRYLSWHTEETSAAERLARTAPDCKLICCLRNPVDRAYSHWRMREKGKREAGRKDSATFREMVQNNTGNCLGRGCYAKHLKRWFRFFSREQLLVQIYDDVVQDNRGAVRDVYEHIGVDPDFVPSWEDRAYNAVVLPGVQKWFRRLGMGRAIKAVRGTGLGDWVRDRVYRGRKNKGGGYEEEMPPDLRQELEEYYASSNEEVENMLGVDLAAWKPCT